LALCQPRVDSQTTRMCSEHKFGRCLWIRNQPAVLAVPEARPPWYTLINQHIAHVVASAQGVPQTDLLLYPERESNPCWVNSVF
jgi:hypothetical protein